MGCYLIVKLYEIVCADLLLGGALALFGIVKSEPEDAHSL